MYEANYKKWAKKCRRIRAKIILKMKFMRKVPLLLMYIKPTVVSRISGRKSCLPNADQKVSCCKTLTICITSWMLGVLTRNFRNSLQLLWSLIKSEQIALALESFISQPHIRLLYRFTFAAKKFLPHCTITATHDGPPFKICWQLLLLAVAKLCEYNNEQWTFPFIHWTICMDRIPKCRFKWKHLNGNSCFY